MLNLFLEWTLGIWNPNLEWSLVGYLYENTGMWIFDQKSRLCYIFNAQPEILIFNVCYKYFEWPTWIVLSLMDSREPLMGNIILDRMNFKRISEVKTIWMPNLSFKSLMDSRGRLWVYHGNIVGPGPIYWILALALVRYSSIFWDLVI